MADWRAGSACTCRRTSRSPRSASARSPSRRSTWRPRTRRSPAMRHLREADGDHEGDPARAARSTRRAAGASRRRSARVSQGVAWKVNDVLGQNALYGTGAGSGDGIHPNAGKTGTTENHADAWFDGYTRQLSTVVWMGYPTGRDPDDERARRRRSRARRSRCRSGTSTWPRRSGTTRCSSSRRRTSTRPGGR